VLIWDLAAGSSKKLFEPKPTARVSAIAVVDAATLVAATDGQIHVVDRVSGTERRMRAEPKRRIAALAVSPDGRLLASGGSRVVGADNDVNLWEIATGRRVGAIKSDKRLPTGFINEGDPFPLEFSRDGARLLVGGQNGVLKIWNVADQRLLSADKERTYGTAGANGDWSLFASESLGGIRIRNATGAAILTLGRS